MVFFALHTFLLLGRQNREKESKMAVAKRQGREKPAKIEQRKVKGRSEDQSEDFRQRKQHSWLSPICIGQAQVEAKTYKRRSQSTLSLSFSLLRGCALSLSLPLSLSLSLPCMLLHSLLFDSLGWHALMLQGWILLLSSK